MVGPTASPMLVRRGGKPDSRWRQPLTRFVQASGTKPRRAGWGQPRACRGPARSCPRRSGCRQLVEASGPTAENLALRLRRELRAIGDHLGRAREEAIRVRIVRRPQDLVRADVLRARAQAALDRLERDPAVTLEQLCGTDRESRVVEALVVEVAVHAVEPGRDPPAAAFEEAHADLRILLAHAAPDHAQ